MSCEICIGHINCPYCCPDANYCPKCGNEMTITDSGRHKNKDWNNFECNCGYCEINEPDPDYGYDEMRELKFTNKLKLN